MNEVEKISYLRAMGVKITMARNIKEIPVLELAKAVGTKRATIEAIEAGESDPSVTLFARICSVLGVKPVILLP
jgi:DNA-binding XRE family transcriptional regulator